MNLHDRLEIWKQQTRLQDKTPAQKSDQLPPNWDSMSEKERSDWVMHTSDHGN